MKPIRMLRTQDGSPNGVLVLSYVKGQEYPAAGFPLSADLRDVFLREGWAEEAGPTGPVDTSAQGPAAAVIVTPLTESDSESDSDAIARLSRGPEAAAAVVHPDASPCLATSPIGEACSLLGGHTSHEWVPLTIARKRRWRRGGA